MRRKSGLFLELDTKAVTEEGQFSGYASVFNTPDIGRDIVMPGAFTKSLAKRPAPKVKLLRDHDPSLVAGVWLGFEEDRKGLKGTGQLILDTALGRETLILMQAGAVDGLSIGYLTVKDRYDSAKKARCLEQIELYEVSLCALPKHEGARVTHVKHADQFADDRDLRLRSAIHRARVALARA